MTFHYSATNPFMQIFNLQGTGLNDGDVYFGVAGQDPITHPITVYWDSGATLPASQPIPTSGGYLYRSGTPANVFLSGPYSIKVLDKNGTLVYYQAEVLDEVLNFINEIESDSGAGLVGASHANDGSWPQATLGEHYSHEIYVTDAPWNANALLVTDNYSAIQAALDFAGAIGGAKVTLPAATLEYNIATGLIIPPSVEFSGQGQTVLVGASVINPASCIKMNGTGQAITLPTDVTGTGSAQIVRNLGILGSPSADGGLCWGNSTPGTNAGNGNSTVENVRVSGFTKTNATGFWFRDCQRATVNDCIISNNYTNIKTGVGAGFRMNFCNVSSNNVSGKAFDATGGPGSGGVSCILNEVYFESCPGQYPIDIRNGGNYWFIGGGYEAMCYSGSGTITNPAVFNIVNPASVEIRVRNVDYFSTGDNLAGTLSFANLNNDIPQFVFSAAVITMNYMGGGRGGATYKFFRGAGYYSNINIGPSQVGGAGFANLAAMMQAYSPLVGTTFSSKYSHVAGWNFQAGVGYVDHKVPYVVAVPNAQTGGTPPLVVTGTATGSYTLPSPYPKGWFSGTDELSIEVTGTRTGAVGAKTGSISLVCGTTITRNITAAATAADSWHATIGLYYIDASHQRLLIDYHDGVTPPVVELLTQDQSANSLTISIGLDVATAAETMTVQTVTMKRTR